MFVHQCLAIVHSACIFSSDELLSESAKGAEIFILWLYYQELVVLCDQV